MQWNWLWCPELSLRALEWQQRGSVCLSLCVCVCSRLSNSRIVLTAEWLSGLWVVFDQCYLQRFYQWFMLIGVRGCGGQCSVLPYYISLISVVSYLTISLLSVQLTVFWDLLDVCSLCTCFFSKLLGYVLSKIKSKSYIDNVYEG